MHTVGGKIAGTKGIVSVTRPRFGKAGGTAVFTATPATGPTGDRTETLVKTVRGERPAAPGNLLAPPERLNDLTPREREVTALAARSRSNDEVAAELVLSVLTVRSHIQRALTELGARDRAQLVVIAYRTGLVRPEPRKL